MGMGTPTILYSSTLFKIALLCVVLYSLRSDLVGVRGDDRNVSVGGVRRRGGGGSVSTSPPVSLSPPSPVWRRRNNMVHRRQFTSPSPSSSTTSPDRSILQQSSSSSSSYSSASVPDPAPLQHLLPDDFINLASNSAGVGLSSESGNKVNPPSSSFLPTNQKIYADPFMLVGEDNILGPTPTAPRRKVFRRTRRRRIRKLKAGGIPTSSSTQEPASYVTTEEEGTEEFASTTSASTENLNKFKYLTTVGSSTQKPTLPSSKTTTMKLEVVPIDSLMQGHTDEVSVEGFTSSSIFSTGPTASPSGTGMNNIKPGYYTRHQKGGGRKRAKSKENLWKSTILTAPAPNFSVELFDNTDATDEQNVSNLDKRESSKSSSDTKNYNMFTLKPTALTTSVLQTGDQSTDESIASPFVNTSLPISTELQNSLQFTLQNLHPLLNSDSVLSQNTPKIPENKTVAITHTLAQSPVDTPVAPDLRFLPAHLRKSHPLLSQETFLDFGGGVGIGGSKTGPRLNVYHQGVHSKPATSGTTTSTTSTSTTERNRDRFSATFARVTPATSTTTTSTTTEMKVLTTSTTSTEASSTSTTSRKTTTVNTSPPPSSTKAYPTPSQGNVHLESLGNLRITEIVYPTNAAPPGIGDMKGYVPPPPRSPPSSTTVGTTSTSSSTIPSTSTKGTTSTSSSTFPSTTIGSTSTTTFKTSSSSHPPSSSSRRPTPVYDKGQASPPLILMGSDSMNSAIESPPAFDDLLLEELLKGFDPPKPFPPSTTSTTTSTTTTTTTTTTTPRPTARTTITRVTTTTPRPPSPPPTPPQKQLPPKQEDETQQLLNLLNLLQANPQSLGTTTEGLKSSSTSTSSSSTSSTLNPTKLDDDFLKNLALLENLLSPTAKTAIKEAVDTGTTDKIKNSSPSTGGQQGLSNADLHQIFALLDAMSTTTPKPTTTTTTTPKPQVIHPALQNMLNMLTNPGQTVQKPVFTLPEPPKPVPTSSSFDLLSQLFNLNGQQQQPKAPQPQQQSPFGALGGLFDSFLPKKTPTNREAATSASNPLLSFFQTPNEPVQTPAPGPYYWFDVNAFLGQDPTAGAMSGIRPKLGTRDYFLKVRRRRDSMESYR